MADLPPSAVPLAGTTAIRPADEDTPPLKLNPADSTGKARSYAIFSLCVLMLTNTLNHLDRQIISILAEPIKNEFGLADWQLGVLTGLSFAVLYGVVSLPAAYLADRTNRVRLLAFCLGTWSLFTAMAGFAQSYAQLVVTRLMVGVAEGGAGGASQSLATDLFPREQRSRALAILATGIPLGTFLGTFIGGVLLDTHGWRAGFVFAGLPGIVLAAIMLLTLRDTQARSRPARPAMTPADFWRRTKEILAVPSFRSITLGGACITFVNFGQAAFLASHFFRSHGDNLDQFAASVAVLGLSLGAGAVLGGALGAAKGLPGVLGTLFGGGITDRLAARNMEWMALLPAIACWMRIPLVVGFCLTSNLQFALACVMLQAFVTGVAAPSGYATVQGVARPDNRSLAAALYMFALNMIGLGLGPLAVGLASDLLQAQGADSGEALKWSLLILGVVALGLGGALKWSARRSIARDTIS